VRTGTDLASCEVLRGQSIIERDDAASGLSDRGADTPVVDGTSIGAADGARGAAGRIDGRANGHSGSPRRQQRRARV